MIDLLSIEDFCRLSNLGIKVKVVPKRTALEVNKEFKIVSFFTPTADSKQQSKKKVNNQRALFPINSLKMLSIPLNRLMS